MNAINLIVMGNYVSQANCIKYKNISKIPFSVYLGKILLIIYYFI